MLYLYLNGTHISELRSVICRMGSHSVTCHLTQVNAPRLNQDRPVPDLPTPEGWKAELTGVGYILRLFTCSQTVTHLSANHQLIVTPLPSHHVLCLLCTSSDAVCLFSLKKLIKLGCEKILAVYDRINCYLLLNVMRMYFHQIQWKRSG